MLFSANPLFFNQNPAVMKQLSAWAKVNPNSTRFIIVVLHILLVNLGIYTGISLYNLGILFPLSPLYGITICFVLLALLYPVGKQWANKLQKKDYYVVRKSFDFLVVTCSFVMVVLVANSSFNSSYGETVNASVYEKGVDKTKNPTAQEILASLSHRDKSSLSRSEKRILKKEFKRLLPLYVKAKLRKDDDTAGKIALTLVAIIGAVGLLYIIAALACNLSCSGSEGAAILVSLLGLIGVIFLLVIVIQKIYHKKPKPAEQEKRENGS